MLSRVVYQLRFVGGPHDGLRVYSTDLPDTHLLFPMERAGAPTALVAYNRLPGVAASIYHFDRTELAGCNANFLPVMRFRFAGFSRSAEQCRVIGRHWLRAAISTKMNGWLAQVRRMMLAPVSYPLQLPERASQGAVSVLAPGARPRNPSEIEATA